MIYRVECDGKRYGSSVYVKDAMEMAKVVAQQQRRDAKVVHSVEVDVDVVPYVEPPKMTWKTLMEEVWNKKGVVYPSNLCAWSEIRPMRTTQYTQVCGMFARKGRRNRK